MDNYRIKSSLCDKIKGYNKLILSKKKNPPNDETLKTYILENNLLNHHCKICSQSACWNKKPLDLVLDRVNNNARDNRLENLRLLCPNCLSQIKKRSTIFEKMISVNKQKCIECDKNIRHIKSNYKNIKQQNYRCKDCIKKAIFYPMINEISNNITEIDQEIYGMR